MVHPFLRLNQEMLENCFVVQLDGAIGEIRCAVVMAQHLGGHCQISFTDIALSLSLLGCLSACFCLSLCLNLLFPAKEQQSSKIRCAIRILMISHKDCPENGAF